MAIGDLATWVAAIGTVGAVFLALYQIDTERKRRIAEEAASRTERRREQARLISAWLGRGDKEKGRTDFYLANGSPEPVYNVLAIVVNVQGAAPRTGEDWSRAGYGPKPMTTATVLPPGRWRVWISGYGWHQHLSGRTSAEVAFTDRNGAHWVRRASGDLEELTEPPFEHFRVLSPYDLVTPEPVDT